MQIQINSDNIINLGDASITAVSSTVNTRLERFAARLTRVEVHFADLDGRTSQSGNDKRYLIEARPAGHDAIAVSHEAATVDAALSGALPKLITALERDFGRTSTRKGH